MQSSAKVVVASQHYPPDPGTTAAIMAEIACGLAWGRDVVVLSGTPGALPASQTGPGKPRVVAVRNRMPGKTALIPVVLVSEPEAEAALTVVENGLGWVVTPGRPDELANAIRVASGSDAKAMAERAVKAAAKFDRATAMDAYAGVIDELLHNPELVGQR